jgi:glycosyltransferase involved in cell wall biosynthesis
MDRPIAYLTSLYARVADTFIRREVEELRRLGWAVNTFSIRRADEGEQVPEEILRERRTTDYVLERGPWRLLTSYVRTWLRSPRRMIRATRQAGAIRWPGAKSWVWHWIYLLEASYLAERLIALDVALLHDHISMNSASVAMLASTLAGVPFSMTVHGPHDFFAPDRWALGKKIAASAMTVCVSDFGKSQCMLFTPPEHWQKLHVVRCGLDEPFVACAPSPNPNAPRLTCVGRLSPEKGQLLLVHAAAMLGRQGIEVEIVLVGDGPLRQEIEGRARELAVEDRIHLVGWQSGEEVRRWISQSRAVVCPSFAEGIPVVLMEAMALRRPVIATYVGGIPELVRNGDDGWLVPAGSVEDLAWAMGEALRMPVQDLDRMGENGRRRVLERHRLSVEVRRLAELFERIVRNEPIG